MRKDRWWEEPSSFFNYGRQETYTFDSVKMAENLKETGCDATHVRVLGGHLNDRKIYFKSRLAKKTNKDQLGELLPELHKRGIKAVIYFNVHCVESEFAEEHPDWRHVTEDGKFKEGVYLTDSSFCVNSPWREWVFQALRDLLKYDIDGIFFDGPNFWPDCCYCEHCRRKFKAKFGKDLPPKSDRKNPLFPKLIEFQIESIAEFVEDCKRIIKENNPNVLFYRNVGNILASKWVLAVDPRSLIKHFDMLGAEGGFLYRDLYNKPVWIAGAMAKLLETQTDGKPYLIHSTIVHKPWGYVMLPKPEVRLLYAETIAHGAYPWFGFRYGFEPEVKEDLEEIEELNRFFKRNKEYYGGTESVARVALLWPVKTINFHPTVHIPEMDFTQRRVEAEAVGDPTKATFGFYEILVRSHIPFDLIDEPALTREKMSKYDLLILPNATCLSRDDVENIRSFVRRGGNLIATFETSHFTEYGEKLNDFLLNDVFGVKSEDELLGPLNLDYATFSSGKGRHHVFRGLTKRWFPAPKYGVKVNLITGVRLMEFCERQRGLSGAQRPPTLPSEPDPLIVTNKYGEGTCFYFAGNVGEEYWNYRHPQYRHLLENCINLHSEKVIELKNGPSSVEVVVRKQEDHARWIIHLINFTGEMTRPIEQITPLHQLEVRLYGLRDVKRVKALRLNRELRYSLSATALEFVLPLLNEYEAILIEE